MGETFMKKSTKKRKKDVKLMIDDTPYVDSGLPLSERERICKELEEKNKLLKSWDDVDS